MKYQDYKKIKASFASPPVKGPFQSFILMGSQQGKREVRRAWASLGTSAGAGSASRSEVGEQTHGWFLLLWWRSHTGRPAHRWWGDTSLGVRAAFCLPVRCRLGGKRASGSLLTEILVEFRVSEASPKVMALGLYWGVIESEINVFGRVVPPLCFCPYLPLFLWKQGRARNSFAKGASGKQFPDETPCSVLAYILAYQRLQMEKEKIVCVQTSWDK